MKRLLKVTLTIADLASLICDERYTSKQLGIRDLEISLNEFVSDDLDDLEAIRDSLEKEIEAIRNGIPDEDEDEHEDEQDE
jgi:hypothetical protein